MMNWKRSTALLTSSLVLSFVVYKIVIACTDGPDPYDYYPQFFAPSVNEAAAFQPFHYTGWIKYYDDWYDRKDIDSSQSDANLKEWASYTGNQVSTADLDSFVYRFPYASLSSLYYNLEKAKPLKLSAEESSNGMTKWFQQNKDLEALGYLMYAKQCEPLVTSSSDWEAPEQDTATRGKLMRNGLQLQKAAKHDAIRERYVYQILRLSFLNEAYKQTLQLYTSLVGDDKKQGTEIFYRCLGYKAGALFRLNRKAEAAYNYALVFDASDDLKKSSYMSFDWATTRDKKAVLALCKSPHETAVVQLMDGLNFYEQALPQLRAAYGADPAVRGLNILFTREINKVEERYQQDRLLAQRNLQSGIWYYDKYMGESPYQSEETKGRQSKWKTYLPQLIAFANQVQREGKTNTPGYWKLATAYLYSVNDEYDKAKAMLAQATDNDLTNRERSLREVINAVLLIRSNGKLDAKTEAGLLPQLQRIEKRGETDPVYAKIYRDIMGTVVSTAYLQARDTVKAVYTLARIDKQYGRFFVSEEYQDLPGTLLQYMSVAKLQDVQAFYASPGKSSWDRWLLQGSGYTLGNLRELEGTKYIRSYEWNKAVNVLQTVPDSVQQRNAFLSPFVAQIPDLIYPDSNVRVASYTKLQFAKEMQGLQGKTDAASLYRYGCGLYTMSYYGWANAAFTYYRSSSDELAYYLDPKRNNLPKEYQEYYGVMSAENYFKQAAASATDKELKAKALWMAAKCWQKRCPVPPGKSYWELFSDSTYYLNALKNPYFARLKAESATADYYQDASVQCSYLADYLRKK
jgi:hypothetical protein